MATVTTPTVGLALTPVGYGLTKHQGYGTEGVKRIATTSIAQLSTPISTDGYTNAALNGSNGGT